MSDPLVVTAAPVRINVGLRLLAVVAASCSLAATAQDAVSAAKAASASARSGSGRLALYAGVGPELSQYDVNVETATLVKGGSVTLPENVQEAWPHPSGKYLYVAWSNRVRLVSSGHLASDGDQHGVAAFRIDPVTGALHPHSQISLPFRPIHVTVDIPGTHLLIAYNNPSGVTVHRLEPDGRIGSQVTQTAPLDAGIYAHQVRVDASNKTVILVTRGNKAAPPKPEDPGALKIFNYRDGLLTNRASVAPGGGFNFQARHMDFHPSRPWIFVSLEPQNKLHVYEVLRDGTLGPQPAFVRDTLAEPNNVRPEQLAGSVHVHPSGKFVYVANRAGGTLESGGQPVFIGGENTIVVYAINEGSGEPTAIQHIDSRGIEPRTFAIDPSGRILVAANQKRLVVQDGKSLSTVKANLAVFRLRKDGRLDFAHMYEVEADDRNSMYWMGLVPRPTQ